MDLDLHSRSQDWSVRIPISLIFSQNFQLKNFDIVPVCVKLMNIVSLYFIWLFLGHKYKQNHVLWQVLNL